jgi:hypothetical protein
MNGIPRLLAALLVVALTGCASLVGKATDGLSRDLAAGISIPTIPRRSPRACRRT